ncbi:MAG: glycosyltransferase family 4 protein [Chitinophagaceae bacterium]|nr:glycosyltransferase family 4 protein [Chitinophagaceae bacterium]
MNIGFDAKRAFHNNTGLGHYSRTLIRSLAEYYPEHEYFLFNPKRSKQFKLDGPHLHESLPGNYIYKIFSSAWRSSWVKNELKAKNIRLYHGLSHEIPFGIQKTGIVSVVTIHDLIHERHPEQYNPLDVKIYSRKFRNACDHADMVIAISEQTKQDIMDFYGTPEQKIKVCYQSCNPAFAEKITEAEKKRVRELYSLPPAYFLYVGSIIERKNLLNICKAMKILNGNPALPLVVIGDGKKYKEEVKAWVAEHGLTGKIIFLSENHQAKQSHGFRTAADFPAIYQMATAMIYPSFFEGFGIPVLEALWSRLPVITSSVSCLPEAGGEGAFYVDPSSPEDIATGMYKIYTDTVFANTMRDKGWKHAQDFSPFLCATSVMNLYKQLW